MNRDEIIEILTINRDKLTELKVKRLALFGSVARGEDRPDSDVDVLVEFTISPTLRIFFELKNYLQNLIGRPIDLGTFDSVKSRAKESIYRDLVHVA